MAAGLPKPPGPGLGATRPTPVAPAAPVTPTQGRPLAGSGFTSTPMGTASPFGADDDSISIDLGPKTPSAPAQAARPSAPVNDPFAAPSVPQTPAPVVPAYSPAPASNAGGFGGAVASQAQASVASALAAGGVPSSDAVTAATREIIERVVWEVVPELAETLIREEIERLLRK